MENFNNGLSGCNLELINNRMLRKHSPSVDYNLRLLSQAEKQIVFSKRIFKNIEVPKVHNIQSSYFDMDYISGQNFEEFFSTASINDIEFVILTLYDYFDSLISTSKNINATTKILKKIDTLGHKSSYEECIQFLKTYVTNNKIIIPHTFCHGDLTFSNILFHKNRLFFIDFLDCYLDTFLSDLVKLKQDLYYLWSVRTQNVYTNRIHQIYNHIWSKLESRYSIFMDENFQIIDIINTLRIEPYLTTDNQRSILEKMIKSSELYAFSCSSNGRSFK